MDIIKRIDQAQQFCKFYADGAYSVETEKWNHHVNPEFIEDIRQYIESLQLKLMHLQTQQAHRAVCKSESYDMIDRFLRNNLYDDDYYSYSEALDEIAATPVAQPKPEPVIPTAIEVQNAKENLALMKRMFGDANEPVAWMFEFPDKRVAPKFDSAPHGGNWVPLYTHPPQRKPLTDADIKLVMNGRGEEGDDAYIKPAFDPYGISEDDLLGFARAIEQAHGIGEKP